MSQLLFRSLGDVRQFDAAVWPYRRILWHAAGLAIAAVVLLLVYTFIVGSSEQEFLGENGLLEHAQLVFLFTATALATATLIRSGRRVGRDRVFWQFVIFAVLCVSIVGITREIQGVNARTQFDELSMARSEKLFVRVFVLLCLPLASAVSAYRLRGQFRSLLPFCHISFLWPAVAFVGCLIASQLSEELNWVFVEETFELVAYSMLVVTCGWLLTTTKLA